MRPDGVEALADRSVAAWRCTSSSNLRAHFSRAFSLYCPGLACNTCKFLHAFSLLMLLTCRIEAPHFHSAASSCAVRVQSCARWQREPKSWFREIQDLYAV